jgi:hypothetical protein
MMAAPPFDEALQAFQRFAQSQNSPTSLRFIESTDIVATGVHATLRRPQWDERFQSARLRYESARREGNGAEIYALAASADELFCCVYVPLSRRDAEQRMIPDDDVKYSIRTPLLAAHFAGPILWWILRRRERSDSRSHDWKTDTFGPAA